uniref:Uncharacterized protein n=1 Tax=Nelumbo nucifera TaxID=4432 RepID=A0A822Z4W1_NELNU|nr:TPA_asm: hypothetical protein HUJ06_015707 [Nelumbo nucifera]
MDGQWVVNKPSRSDEVLDADEQLRIADQIRAHFHFMAPKRPIKPNRSETADTSATAPFQDSDGGNIPELDKFLSLRSQSLPVSVEEGGASLVQEEFVETQYYKEFNSIDKQHHTTGNGFIRVVGGGGDGYGLQLQRGHEGISRRETTSMRFRSNPATNDWIPSAEGEEREEVIQAF